MTPTEILKDAKENFDNAVLLRRNLHQNAEVGFKLDKTLKIVKSELEKNNIDYKMCGKAGIVADIGKDSDRTFLIRADMDALKLEEQTGLDFASKNGNMHACGHDFHTAMLLTAAKILKKHEQTIRGRVRLMFQGAEENLSGAKDMIENGLFSDIRPDGAMMIHIIAAMPLKAGSLVVTGGGVSAPAADFFEIELQGKGIHGAMPYNGIDPVVTSSHLIINLQNINSRETPSNENMALTIGKISGADSPNVIPDSVKIGGTCRCFSEDTRAFIKKRITEISENTAKTFRAEAKTTFLSGCPTLENDNELSKKVLGYLKELIGDGAVSSQSLIQKEGEKRFVSSGSEDFAYVSHEVPSVMVALAGGEKENGYKYNQHHPKVDFDETALINGSAAYAYAAIRFLEDK